MQRRLSKAVIRRFGEFLKARLPQFVEIAREPGSLNSKVYEWEISPGRKAYVALYLSRRDDAFTIDVAWSHQGRFPAHLGLMEPRSVPRARIRASEPIEGEFLTRLPSLFSDRDEWWEVIPRLSVEEILERQQQMIETGQLVETPIEVGFERLDSLVRDAVNKIADYAVPWFVEHCSART